MAQALGDRAAGIDVRDTGARGDGRHDDAPAIQKALESGAGTVVVGAGTYRIGQTLRIGSNTRLLLHPSARMVLAEGAGRDSGSFLLANRNQESGDRCITVEGGIWDGNNPGNLRGPDAPGSYTGAVMDFRNLDSLVLRGVTLRDAEAYYLRIGESRRFLVEDVVFEAPHLRPNQDGVHLGGFCEDGVIRRLRGVGFGCTNDDMVALNADDALGRAQNLGLKCGPIRRIRIEDIRAGSCHTFVRLLSVGSVIEDIEIEGIYGGCHACALNMDACRQCRVKLFEDEGAYPAGVGDVRRVTVRRMHVHKANGGSRKALLDLTTRCTDFRMLDFRRDAERDGEPEAPTMSLGWMDPCEAAIDGLSGAQEAGVTTGQGVEVRSRVRLPTPRGLESSHMICTVPRGELLLLREGGIGSLQLNCADGSLPF
jgi:polygalacturonase